jgi:hypothetical protein
MSEPREYWVGLPVGIKVHDDGLVTWTIDTSEAGDGISEEAGTENGSAPNVTEDQMLRDYAIAYAQPEVTVDSRATEPYRCPVLFACDFRTEDLADLADHILNGTHEGTPS